MDSNKYPLDQAKHSDDQNRPIGIGVQGLSEVFMMMQVPFDSSVAVETNKMIFETMYYAALVASNNLAITHGPYKSFSTSPTASGVLQFDLWGIEPSSTWDWTTLKANIIRHGLRNSLLIAIMPTAGTSIISGHTESVEVPQSNVFTRSTLSGRFQVVNKYLVRELKALGLWTKQIRNKIIENEGSVQNIEEIPERLREVFKTVYEYKLTTFIKMCADREAFVCQSASNNRYLVEPDIGTLTMMHLFSWKQGLKTSSYYCRVKQRQTGTKLLDMSPPTTADLEEEECLSCTA
jgi:ribonucleotide reductase alpha subunit